MATQSDLALAKRLMAARILTEEELRAAFAFQERLRGQGKQAALDPILYHLGYLPKGSLAVLRAPPPLESQPLRDYRLEGVLGEGGSSVVYAGVYRPNGTPVAIKVLDPIQALREEFLQRFLREAEILIELEHANIVLGYEVGCQNGWNFFSMDRVDGLTVLEVIDRRGFLSNEEALSISLQAARALKYLHDSGYLHRDIKPGNIMVEASGLARMIDLGLIRAMPREGDVARPGEETTTVGTVEYLSPEQARGSVDLDPRSDIYSLGVSLYHMVVGEVPFSGDSSYEVMAKQVLSALDTQKVKTRRIAPEVHFFITKMTSKERELRFETVEEVIANLEAYVPGGLVPVDLGVPRAAVRVAPPVAAPIATPVAPVAPVVKPLATPIKKPVRPVKPAARKRSPDAPTPRRTGGAPAPKRKRRRGR